MRRLHVLYFMPRIINNLLCIFSITSSYMRSLYVSHFFFFSLSINVSFGCVVFAPGKENSLGLELVFLRCIVQRYIDSLLSAKYEKEMITLKLSFVVSKRSHVAFFSENINKK